MLNVQLGLHNCFACLRSYLDWWPFSLHQDPSLRYRFFNIHFPPLFVLCQRLSKSREPHGGGVISDLIYQNFGSFHCFLPLFLGPILNWLLQCFCRLFQNKPRHHHHSRRATSSSRHRPPGSPPSPGRAASHSLVCEQMDAVAADAFAAFIIVYALFIVVVLPINLSIEPLVSLSLTLLG